MYKKAAETYTKTRDKNNLTAKRDHTTTVVFCICPACYMTMELTNGTYLKFE